MAEETSTKLQGTDPEVMACPHAFYAQLHADPVGAVDGGPLGWIVAGSDDIAELALKPKLFSSEVYGPAGPMLIGVSPEPPSDEVLAKMAELKPMANAFFSVDPPTHTRQKAIASKALNAARIRALEPKMREEARALIDAFASQGRCDFFDDFATWFPLILISDLLGCDRADLKQFKVWTEHIADAYLAILDNDQRLTVLQSVKDFQDYMLPRVEARRQQPVDDLLSALVNTKLDLDEEGLDELDRHGPRELTDNEVLPAIAQLLVAGNHTTTNALVNLMVSLVENPEAMAAVRADNSLIPSAIEESLRLDAPSRSTFRVTTGPAEVGCTALPAGSMVNVLWGAAGHDPEIFDEPTRFDPTRSNVRQHLSFGKGPHFCVGNQLARVQMRVAFEELLARMDDIRFADGKAPARRPHFPFSEYEQLELVFTAKPQ